MRDHAQLQVKGPRAGKETWSEIYTESSNGTIIIKFSFFYMEQYCLCGNISHVDFPNIKSLYFSLNKSSMAGERPSHRVGGLHYMLCCMCGVCKTK